MMPKYTVDVFINDNWIASRPGVVADDAAEAEQIVLDGLNIDVVAEEDD